MNNSLFAIFPYKENGQWMFDDNSRGLLKEPLVCGIDLMAEKISEKIQDAENGFRLIFSANPFPNFTVELEWRRSEFSGNWYWSERFQMEGWLCPALGKYFADAPRKLFGRAESKN